MEILLPVSTVISQVLPLIVPAATRLSVPPCSDPVLKISAGAVKCLAELRPSSPATVRLPKGKRRMAACSCLQVSSDNSV